MNALSMVLLLAVETTLLPQIDRRPSPPQLLRTRLDEALKVGLAAIRTAGHVVERRRKMERPQIAVGAKNLRAIAIEEHEAGRVDAVERARPLAFTHSLPRC